MMRYLLTFLLLSIFPIYCPGIFAADDSSQYPPVSGGTVTTRTGGPVITRSSEITTKKAKPQERAAPAKTSKIKSKKSKTPQKQTPAEEDNNSVSGELRKESNSYRKEAYKLQQAGDLRSALMYYQKAVQLDPYNIELLNDLGVTYEGLGDANSAANSYKKAIELNPDYLPAYTNLGLLYESKGDIRNATYYWQKRYELGKPGDYWKKIAQDHLMQLGTFPEVQQKMVDKEVAMLSRDLADRKMERKSENINDAKLHYYIGTRLFVKKDYTGALKEFETALSLNPADEDLKNKIMDFYKKTEKAYAKDKALTQVQDAASYIRNDDFFTAEEKLRSALSTVFRVAQEK